MPKLQHILPILFTWLSLWLAVRPLTALFISIFADSSGLIPELSSFAVLLLCSLSLELRHAPACSHRHLISLNRYFSQPLPLLLFYSHSPSPRLFVASVNVCVGVDLKWRQEAECHRVQTHMKKTPDITRYAYTNMPWSSPPTEPM